MTSQKIPKWSVPLNMKFLFNVRTHDVGGRRRMTIRETQESAGVESCAKKCWRKSGQTAYMKRNGLAIF